MTEQYAVVDTRCAISYYLGSKSVDRFAIDHLRKIYSLLVSKETFSEFREVILRKSMFHKHARVEIVILSVAKDLLFARGVHTLQGL
jgi:hypothetical protein